MGAADQRVVIVTGASSGLGRETALGCAAAGATVVMACRDPGKAERVRAELAREVDGARLVPMHLELADLASVRRFAAEFRARFSRLDVLVNNAGLWTLAPTTTAQGFETTLGVNYLAPALLTRELMPVLEASAPSRVLLLTSSIYAFGRIGWDDPSFEGRRYTASRAYAQSKLAVVMYALALARRTTGRRVDVNALHNGVVATELTREYPMWIRRLMRFLARAVPPAVGARPSLRLALAPELTGVSGRYFSVDAEQAPSRAARDVAAQERLWAWTEALLDDAGAAR